MGHSAGAHLVTRVAVDEEEQARAGLPEAAVCGVMPISGAAFDLTDRRAFEIGENYDYYGARFGPPGEYPELPPEGPPAEWQTEASIVPFLDADEPPFLVVYAEGDYPALIRQAEVLLGALALFSVSSSVYRAPTYGLISLNAGPNEQGEVMGVTQSIGSLARIIGPLFALGLLDVSIRLPYFICAVIAVAAAIVAAFLLKPADKAALVAEAKLREKEVAGEASKKRINLRGKPAELLGQDFRSRFGQHARKGRDLLLHVGDVEHQAVKGHQGGQEREDRQQQEEGRATGDERDVVLVDVGEGAGQDRAPRARRDLEHALRIAPIGTGLGFAAGTHCALLFTWGQPANGRAGSRSR